MPESHFNLNYKLTGQGWATCEIELGDQRATVTASYLSDALGQLVTATLLLRQGAHISSASFDEEPGEYRWVFDCYKSPSDETSGIRVRIYEFEELWAHKPASEGAKILDGVVQTEVFYRSMLDMIEEVIAEYGEEGYEDKWDGEESKFPTIVYNELTRLIDVWPGAM
tara:strand:- start:28131 stop:28634 length:504 start_codon:yes stop_codon:yes gene_type:complete